MIGSRWIYYCRTNLCSARVWRIDGRGHLPDPYLEIYNANGVLVDQDDNGSWLNDARGLHLRHQTAATTLLLKLRRQTKRALTGIRVREPDDHGQGRESTTQLNLDTAVEGSIQWADDQFGAKSGIDAFIVSPC